MYKHITISMGKYDVVFSTFIFDIIKCVGVQATYYSNTFSVDIGFVVIDFGIMVWKAR